MKDCVQRAIVLIAHSQLSVFYYPVYRNLLKPLNNCTIYYSHSSTTIILEVLILSIKRKGHCAGSAALLQMTITVALYWQYSIKVDLCSNLIQCSTKYYSQIMHRNETMYAIVAPYIIQIFNVLRYYTHRKHNHLIENSFLVLC